MKVAFNPQPALKLLLVLPGLLVLLFACKKNNFDDDLPPDQSTPIPTSTSDNTTLSLYIDAFATDHQVSINHTYFIPEEKGFFTKQGKFDRFYNIIDAAYEKNGTRHAGLRIIPVTPSTRNYADIACSRRYEFGSVTSSRGAGVFNMIGGGKVIYPEYAFGHDWTNRGVSLSCNFNFPDDPDFAAIRMTTSVDYNNMRWYLQPFLEWDFHILPVLKPGYTLDIEIPIPANLPGNAPDSVEGFRRDNKHRWTLQAVLYKQGGFYKGKLPSEGDWVFGVRQQGAYKTVEVRTAGGIPVVNAKVDLGIDTMNIATARTDADGNAIFFLPLNTPLNATVLSRWNSNEPNPLKTSIAPFNYAQITPIRITYPANAHQLRIVKGKAYQCDGSPIQRGVVTIAARGGSVEYGHFPIVNGQFKGAIAKDVIINEIYVLNAHDDISNITGRDTGIASEPGVEKEFNLVACNIPKALFMNYTLDGVNFSVNNDGTQPTTSPRLVYNHSFNTASIMASNDLLLLFSPNFQTTGTRNLTFSPLVVKGNTYWNGRGSVTFTRYDLIETGYVEGSFDIKYWDSSGVEHSLTGNFRVYRES